MRQEFRFKYKDKFGGLWQSDYLFLCDKGMRLFWRLRKSRPIDVIFSEERLEEGSIEFKINKFLSLRGNWEFYETPLWVDGILRRFPGNRAYVTVYQ